MEEHINYSAIANQRGMNEKINILQDEIARVEYISLTDALMYRKEGGQFMLEFLDDESKSGFGEKRTWKIKMLRHPDGREVKKGDVFTRTIQKPLRHFADKRKKLSSKDINNMRIRGDFEDKYIVKKEFIADTDGCITCDYDDAGWWLMTHGVHYQTNYGICGKRELSGGDGRSRAQWNWLCKEVPPWKKNKKS